MSEAYGPGRSMWGRSSPVEPGGNPCTDSLRAGRRLLLRPAAMDGDARRMKDMVCLRRMCR